MSDYAKATVAELRVVLKERGIPSTGLTRKAQIIEKLEQDDASKVEQQSAEPTSEVPDVQVAKESGATDGQAEEIGVQAANADEIDKASDKGEGPMVEADAVARHETIKPEEEPSGDAEQPSTSPTEEMHKPSPTSTATLQAEDAHQTQMDSEIEAKPSGDEPMVEAAEGHDEAPVAQEPVNADSQAMTGTPMDSAPSSVPTVSRVPTDELVEDTKKRKRRSQSPPISISEAARKRLKQDEGDSAVHLTEDLTVKQPQSGSVPMEADAVMSDGQLADKGEAKSAPLDVEMEDKAQSEPLIEDPAPLAVNAEERPREESAPTEQIAPPRVASPKSPAKAHSRFPSNPPDSAEVVGNGKRSPSPAARRPSVKDHRYKDLFGNRPADSTRRPSVTDREERTTVPALHSATSALYIRDFMRPLQPGTLKEHLISLATPPNSSPNADILKEFHLDSIRTHCFALFSSVSAASRVRSAIHGNVWPNERTRKPLWADFVPEEKVTEWIGIERDTPVGRGASAKRWEVIYDDGPNGIEAIFQEAGARGPHNGMGGPRPSFSGSTQGMQHRQSIQEDRRPSIAAPKAPKQTEASFVALDQLFKSTKAKPKLYFLPVSTELVDRRLDEFDKLTSRRASVGGGRLDEYRRYTFEEGDLLVDDGPEYPARFRGGGGGRGRGGYRGDRGDRRR